MQEEEGAVRGVGERVGLGEAPEEGRELGGCVEVVGGTGGEGRVSDVCCVSWGSAARLRAHAAQVREERGEAHRSCSTWRNSSLTPSPLSFHSSLTSTSPFLRSTSSPSLFSLLASARSSIPSVLYGLSASTSGCAALTPTTTTSPLTSLVASHPFLAAALTSRSSFLNEPFLTSAVAPGPEAGREGRMCDE